MTAAALLVTFVALAASVSVYAHPTQDWNTMALSNMAERGVSATYIGCFTDGSPRLLPAPVYSGPLNTPDYCTNLCALNGFMLAGVECEYTWNTGDVYISRRWRVGGRGGGDTWDSHMGESKDPIH